MTGLFVTADAVGSETSGGSVTSNELAALSSLVGEVDVINPPMFSIPFETDQVAVQTYSQLQRSHNLAHFYSGTFSKLVTVLKEKSVKVTYTVAAHDVQVSKEEHEWLGVSYAYPHLTDPQQFSEYIRGYKEADLIICPSTHSRDVMIKYGGERVVVIPHGCHMPAEPKPLLTKPFVVGYLGAAGPDKGLKYLLQAWSMLNYKDALLIMAGKEMPQIVPVIRSLSSRGSIQILGWVKTPSELYNQCTLYCQPSASEGFGLEIIEAMAHGRPVVASNGAGGVDCITDGQDGFIVEKRNAKTLAEAIDRYKKNFDMVLAHGEQARKKAANYTWDRIKEQYVQVWKGLMA